MVGVLNNNSNNNGNNDDSNENNDGGIKTNNDGGNKINNDWDGNRETRPRVKETSSAPIRSVVGRETVCGSEREAQKASRCTHHTPEQKPQPRQKPTCMQ